MTEAFDEGASAQFKGVRTFAVDGEEWTARIAGEGNTGTGMFSFGVLVVVLFHRGEEERASRFAYLPRGRLEHMYESELRFLFEEASAVREPDSEPGSRPDTRPRADGTMR